MDYNNELQEIDTEQKAYFLGFMYADGCITAISRKNSKYIKYQVQISLTDEQIINDFKTVFPFFNLQTFDFGKYKSTWSKQHALRKANKKLFDDLLKHGMLQRKSGEEGKLLKMPKLSKKLLPHFIRGYFDGDGSINIPKKRPNTRTAEICSSSKEFLLQVKHALENLGVKCPIFREKHTNVSPLYVLEWVNHTDMIMLREFFYKDANIFLERKKEKFYSFTLPVNINPLCVCGNKTHKAGKRQMKHGLMLRYTCSTCDKKFSIPAPCKKQDELSGKPCEGNQQPSLDSNIFEGSTTNRRVPPSNVEDSNSDTSVLPSVTLHNFIINENGELVKAYWSDDIV